MYPYSWYGDGGSRATKSLHLSQESPSTVRNIRSRVREEFDFDPSSGWHFLSNSGPVWTFILPNFSDFPTETQKYISKDLICQSHLHDLTAFDPVYLNWSPELSHLLPLKTSGDGNCLLHSVSLSMWGIHDRNLELRKMLHMTINGQPGLTEARSIDPSDGRSSFYLDQWSRDRRIAESSFHNRNLFYKHWIQFNSANLSSKELDRKWKEMSSLSSTYPIRHNLQGAIYESLEQYHIFVLAHILRRPIIVFGDRMMRDETGKTIYEMTVEDRMDGIYLPLLWPSDLCSKDPVLLSFSDMHFSSVVACKPSLLLHNLHSDTGTSDPSKQPGSSQSFSSPSSSRDNQSLLSSLSSEDDNQSLRGEQKEDQRNKEKDSDDQSTKASMKEEAEDDKEKVNECELPKLPEISLETRAIALIPLVDSQRNLSPIHFRIHEENKVDPVEFLKCWLDVSETTSEKILVAKQHAVISDSYVKELIDRYFSAAENKMTTQTQWRTAPEYSAGWDFDG